MDQNRRGCGKDLGEEVEKETIFTMWEKYLFSKKIKNMLFEGLLNKPGLFGVPHFNIVIFKSKTQHKII